MALAPQKDINEMLGVLTHHIDNKIILDDFTLRRFIAKAEKIPDDPIKLMALGLAYGAAGQHQTAIDYFKEAVKYHDDVSARNYLSYLSHTGEYELYREEAIRMAKEIVSLPLYIKARNAAYADGDPELTLFFARKVLSVMGDDKERESVELEQRVKEAALKNFIDATNLKTSEISKLTRSIAHVAKKYDVLAVAQDFYTTEDGDAAVICDVLCFDANVISDMDIDVATELAMNETFSDKNITAWFRGRDANEVGGA
ncbi:hypothetical protein PO486_13990 [Atlantibacter hermannii]|uniref:tetratricopeptide repeat protein n=1 Tax=Atlantibacter hermannii TaxID=565 RepID=UPI0028A2DCE7|nr:hypothetical protein [Atlantibacter hermannii]